MLPPSPPTPERRECSPAQPNREKRKRRNMANRIIKFFMPMIPPTKTAQEKKVTVRKGKPVMYEPPELKAVRQKLLDSLILNRPEEPLTGPIELVVDWCFPSTAKHNGQWKTTKPDTDNLQKMLKDCMTKAGFWKDDALVCREIIEKFWAITPGIYIRASEMGGSDD